jgi:hypothetical protein
VIDNGQPWPQFSCVSYLSSPAVKVFVAGDFCALLGLVWRTII